MFIRIIHHSVVLAILFLTIFGCTTRPTQDSTEPALAQATPQVLTEQRYTSDVRSFSGKRYTDMVNDLYEEAGRKDKALQDLYRHINTLAELREDSLKAYQSYNNTHEKYLQDAMSLSDQILDTILREETKAVLLRFQKDYRNTVSEYENKRLSIDQKAAALHDQLILLKLATTQSMIKNYQVNEKPNIEALQEIIEAYDEVIKESKALIK